MQFTELDFPMLVSATVDSDGHIYDRDLCGMEAVNSLDFERNLESTQPPVRGEKVPNGSTVVKSYKDQFDFYSQNSGISNFIAQQAMSVYQSLISK